MELKSITGGVLATVIMVVIACAVLVPVTNSASAEYLTYMNEGTPYMAPDGETHTIEVGTESSTTVIVDGEICALPTYTDTVSIVYSDVGFIRLTKSDNHLSVTVKNNNSVLNVNAPATITIADTTASVSTATLEQIRAFIAPEGEYVLTNTPHVTPTTEIIGGGNTYKVQPGGTGNATNFWGTFTGTVEDNLTMVQAAVIPSSVSVEISNPATVDMEQISGNLYKINSLTWGAVSTYTDSSTHAFDIVYTYYLVPTIVSYENPNYTGGSNAALIGIIPLLVFVGITLGVVGSFIRNRD